MHAPQFFEVVVGAHRGLHDVHDHFAQIDQHPFAAVFAFGAVHRFAEFLEFYHHIVGQRLGLARGLGAGDDHALEQRAEFAGVDDGDVECFDVFQGGDDGLSLFFCV